jgi:hypothetical protein
MFTSILQYSDRGLKLEESVSAGRGCILPIFVTCLMWQKPHNLSSSFHPWPAQNFSDYLENNSTLMKYILKTGLLYLTNVAMSWDSSSTSWISSTSAATCHRIYDAPQFMYTHSICCAALYHFFCEKVANDAHKSEDHWSLQGNQVHLLFRQYMHILKHQIPNCLHRYTTATKSFASVYLRNCREISTTTIWRLKRQWVWS